MVTWYWSADTLFWQVSINQKMDVQYQRCMLKTSMILVTLAYMEGWTYVLTYVRTVDDVMVIKPIFLASMGYHIFLTMVGAELRYNELHICTETSCLGHFWNIKVRKRGQNRIRKHVGIYQCISFTFLRLGPLHLSFKLNFNISKKAYF